MFKCRWLYLALTFASGASALARGLNDLSQEDLRRALAGQPRCYLWVLDPAKAYSGKHMRLVVADSSYGKLFFLETEQDGNFNIVYLSRVGLTADGYILAAPGSMASPKIQASIDIYRGKAASVQLTSSSWYSGEERYSGSCYSVTASLDSNILDAMER